MGPFALFSYRIDRSVSVSGKTDIVNFGAEDVASMMTGERICKSIIRGNDVGQDGTQRHQIAEKQVQKRGSAGIRQGDAEQQPTDAKPDGPAGGTFAGLWLALSVPFAVLDGHS
ncbi:hypothetical protein FDECE_15123 [Fusarium decemcellulare]|nr:hypothetical protein FDECE_15123 [Fusarium decemcellulare]